MSTTEPARGMAPPVAFTPADPTILTPADVNCWEDACAALGVARVDRHNNPRDPALVEMEALAAVGRVADLTWRLRLRACVLEERG